MRRLGRAVAVSLGILVAVLGLPAPPALAAPTATDPITYVYDEVGRLEAVIDRNQTSLA